ncbi:MAG: SMP-30/gluconolactonase/LRE family protein [Inquilinaceae bacterium]
MDDVSFVGHDLHRPECVLCTKDGSICVADWRGGVTVLAPDGRQHTLLARTGGPAPKPNGIGLLPDGTFLLTHLGDTDGGVFRLDAAGDLRPVLTEIDGAAMPPTNFVVRDRQGRIWVTVSTRRAPRALSYRATADDGFIVLLDGKGARIVADGLGYTNECVIDPDGSVLHVNETFTRRLTRFAIAADGSLGDRRTICEFGEGTFPDGLALDENGGLWVTSIVSNRIIRVDPDGTVEVVLDDSDPTHVGWVEDAYRGGTMGRPHLDRARGRRLANISSLAFGGPDLRTAYLGCLLGDRIARFQAPLAGAPPAHWEVRPALPGPPGADNGS